MKMLLLFVSFLSLFTFSPNKSFTMENKQEIYSIETILYDKNVPNTISIWGKYYENSPYVTDIEIKVFQGTSLIYSFVPKTNYGFSPKLLALDFKGNGLNQIFYSADSGGSGGYGFYYVFELNQNEAITLFDYEIFSENNKYKGRFLDDFRAIIEGNGKQYHLDVSNMDEFYKDLIYTKEGKVKLPEIDIGEVNTVFPYYNSTLNMWLLQVYQKTTAVAQVNVLGYAVNNLLFDNNQFNNFWSTFNIY